MLNPQICVLTACAFCLGYFLAYPPPGPPQLEIQGVAWCWEGDYPSMKAMTDATSSHRLIDVHGKGVTVYERCTTI